MNHKISDYNQLVTGGLDVKFRGWQSAMTTGDTYLFGEIGGNIEKLSFTLCSGLKYFRVNIKYYSNKTYARNSTTLNLLYPFGDLVKVSYLCQFTLTLHFCRN